MLIEDGRVVEEELVFADDVVDDGDDGEGGRRYCCLGIEFGGSVVAIVDGRMV